MGRLKKHFTLLQEPAVPISPVLGKDKNANNYFLQCIKKKLFTLWTVLHSVNWKTTVIYGKNPPNFRKSCP